MWKAEWSLLSPWEGRQNVQMPVEWEITRKAASLHPQRRDRHLEVDVTQAVAGKNVIVESCSITWRKAGNASCGEERCKKEQRVGGQLLL